MSLLLPPMFTTVRMNNLHPDGIDKIFDELQRYIQQLESSLSEPSGNLTIFRHPRLPNLCVIPSIIQSVYPVGQTVVVDKLCGMAVMRGADVFIPGVLCMPKGLSAGDVVAIYVHIGGKCLKGMTEFNGETLFIGNATSLVSRSDIFVKKVTKGIAFKMKQSLFFAPCLDNVLSEKIFMQNIPSVVVGHVLDPQPEEVVLDMCAAPGGKLLHLYELMEGKGTLVAVDRSERRTSKMVDNIKKMKADPSVFKIITTDSRMLCSDVINQDKLEFASFDRILLDAPCSALGQRPRIIMKNLEETPNTHYLLQRQLFSAAVKLLKVGGTLVYSTCTTATEENEGLVEWALKNHGCISLIKQEPHLGHFGRKNVSSLTQHQLECLQVFELPEPVTLNDFTKNQTNSCFMEQLFAKNTLPEQDTIGFFISKFLKIS